MPTTRARFFVVVCGAVDPSPRPSTAIDDLVLPCHVAAGVAGAGLKRGLAYGTSDAIGWKAAENPVDAHDFHATILHLLGIDHTRRTFYHNGIRRRLTNVHGHVLKDILA